MCSCAHPLSLSHPRPSPSRAPVFPPRPPCVSRYITHRASPFPTSGSLPASNLLSLQVWAEKEYRNLTRLRNAGIKSPEPKLLRSHVLVMEFIGTDGVAAPRLKVCGPSIAMTAEGAGAKEGPSVEGKGKGNDPGEGGGIFKGHGCPGNQDASGFVATLLAFPIQTLTLFLVLPPRPSPDPISPSCAAASRTPSCPRTSYAAPTWSSLGL